MHINLNSELQISITKYSYFTVQTLLFKVFLTVFCCSVNQFRFVHNICQKRYVKGFKVTNNTASNERIISNYAEN